MTTMNLTDTSLRTMKIDLPGGRCLRLALTFDRDGAPADLCIGCGFTSDAPLKVLASGLNVPASALPQLRDALAEMAP